MLRAFGAAHGAGKTIVIAMLIAWQTTNAVRAPGSQKFSKGFLIVAPGITVHDRLQVLMLQHEENYYRSRDSSREKRRSNLRATRLSARLRLTDPIGAVACSGIAPKAFQPFSAPTSRLSTVAIIGMKRRGACKDFNSARSGVLHKF